MKRTSIVNIISLSCLLVFTFAIAGPANSGGQVIDPNSYPEIGDEEMGQLRFAIKMADRPLDDFSDMEGIDQYGMTAYRYCIAFMTYFLAAEQYHKLPACPEIIQPRMDRFIHRRLSFFAIL